MQMYSYNSNSIMQGSPQLIDGRFTAVEIPMPLSARCFVNTTDPDINPDCAGQTEIMIHTFGECHSTVIIITNT